MKTRNLYQPSVLIVSLAFVFAAGSTWFSPLWTKDISSEKQSENPIIKEGLSIAMAIDPVAADKQNTQPPGEGDDAVLKFTVLDAASNEPVKGLHPAVWLARQTPQQQEVSCREQINSFLQGQLAVRPEVDLNAYYLLVLNDKASISVIDPINGFGGSKLITRIMLNSPGDDWVLSKDRKTLYVATPLSREVAVIDTASWKALAFLAFDAAPIKLALQPDGKYLWVELAANSKAKTLSSVRVIDTEKNRIRVSLDTGPGRHDFAFSDDSRFAYVSNPGDQTISIIDAAKLATIKAINVPAAPVSLAFSKLSKSLYATLENGQIVALDAASQQLSARINLGAKLKTLRFNAEERWGFALSQSTSKVFVIDVADNRLLNVVDVTGVPDQVAFTDTFAYVRSTGSEIVSMIELDALGKQASLPVTTFPAGQKAPGESSAILPNSDAIAPTPERHAVVVANPADKTVYYYMEGMAAPMGSFENFGLAPTAVMVIDRSLREAPPGVYSGTMQLPPAGTYSAAILLDTPPVFHCFDVNIGPNTKLAKQTAQPATVEYLLEQKEVSAGKAIQVKLKINNTGNAGVKDGATDVQVLIFRIPGVWQQRKLAKPLGDGLYEVEITPPEAGVYQIFTQSPSLNFTFEQQPPLTFRAVKAQTAGVIAN